MHCSLHHSGKTMPCVLLLVGGCFGKQFHSSIHIRVQTHGAQYIAAAATTTALCSVCLPFAYYHFRNFIPQHITAYKFFINDFKFEMRKKWGIMVAHFLVQLFSDVQLC